MLTNVQWLRPKTCTITVLTGVMSQHFPSKNYIPTGCAWAPAGPGAREYRDYTGPKPLKHINSIIRRACGCFTVVFLVIEAQGGKWFRTPCPNCQRSRHTSVSGSAPTPRRGRCKVTTRSRSAPKNCRFIGFNKISHENISGKRAASGGAGLIVSGPAKKGKG
jgi:hypothetical protein